MEHIQVQRPIVVKRKSDCYRQQTEWINKQRHNTSHVLPGGECAYEFIFSDEKCLSVECMPANGSSKRR